jgi:hypothetical protein
LILAALLGLSSVRAAAQQAVDYLATVLRLKTPEGVLVIEASDPGIGIRLDGSDLVVTGAGVKELRLAVGRHHVQALKDGKVLQEELVTISRGGRTVLAVHREPDVQPPATARTDRQDSMRRSPAEKLADALLGRSDQTEHGAGAVAMEGTAVLGPRPPGRAGEHVPAHPLPMVSLGEVGDEVRTLAFSPDGRVLAYGVKNGRIGLWDWRSLIEVVPVGDSHASFFAHHGGVESVGFALDGKTLASGGWDHHVKHWDLCGGSFAAKVLWDFAGYSDGVRSVAFSPDGEHLATGGFD